MQDTIINTSAATSTLFLGQNGEWWDFWLIISVVFAALAATAIGVTTTGSITTHKREATESARNLERFKLETGKEIAVANARADEANALALQAQVELERFKAPRSLDEGQRKQIADAIRSFPGQQYATSITPGPDALSVLGLIEESLNSAGWVRVPPLGGIITGTEPNTVSIAIVAAPGVRIQFSPNRSSPDAPQFKAALVLASALKKAGIAAEASLSPDVDARPNAIQIMIGYKPID